MVDILTTVYPMMAWSAKRYQVVAIKSILRAFSPRQDVVSMDPALPAFPCTATNASVRIAQKHSGNSFLPFCRRIQSLAFRAATVFVVGIGLASMPTHAIPRTTEVGLLNRCFLTQNTSGLFRVLLSKERIDHPLALHVTINPLQVLATRTCRDVEVAQLLVNPFGITTDQSADVIGRQPFVDVLGAKPCRIKVRGFHEEPQVWRDFAKIQKADV